MGIGDLFRARHKHSDREVRLEAVKQLGAEDGELLAEIARSDDDAEIVREAIDRIDDPDVLLSLGADGVAGAQARASDLLGRIAAGQDPEAAAAAVDKLRMAGHADALGQVAQRAPLAAIRQTALSHIADPKVLADVARGSDDEQTARDAVDRIDDVELLRGIADAESRKAVGLAAVDRIDDNGVLDHIASRAQHKAVRARARKKITDAQPETAVEPERLAHAERVQLTRIVEKLAGTEDYLRAAEVEEAARRFEELGVGGDAELAARFDKALSRFREGAARHAPKLPGPKQVVEVPAPARPAKKAKGKKKPDKPEDKPETEAKPAEPPRPAKKRDLAEVIAELEALGRDLMSVATSDRLKTLNRAINRCDSKLAELGELPGGAAEVASQVQAARQALVIQAGVVKEQMEWQQWSNVPKQEELIKRASELAADESATKLGDKLKKLQADWKAVGPVPRDKAQALWEAFKVACDAIYERVKVERAALQAERRENLAKKTALAEQAEALADSEDWEETAAALKRLQAEWKKIGPAPRKQADKVWKRFRSACDLFFERRKPHLDEQLAEHREAIERKTAVVEKAEALVGDPSDAGERLVTLDDLRRQFSRAGRVPSREFGKLRGRMDSVEKKLKAERVEQRKAADQARAAAEAELVAAVDEVIGKRAAGESVVEPLCELRGKLRDAGDRVSEALAAARDKLDAEIAAAIEADPASFAGSELDPAASRQRREKLCARLEDLVPAGEAEPQTAEEMAERLRAALADRALGGVLSKEADPRKIKKVLAEVEKAWARTGPVPGAEGQALDQRYAEAVRRARAKL